MPIESPQLDDLSFARTFEELRRRIPVYAPEWTDHNDSDPGIALLQLFAYLSEQIGYRLNRIPEKNHVELLKLLGVRLQPARAARTTLALLLSSPSSLSSYALTARKRAQAKQGNPPPIFETETSIDVIPAEPTLFVTTKNPYLHDLLLTDSGRETPSLYPKSPSDESAWHHVAWNGKQPKLFDMPLEPVKLRHPEHRYWWVGLDANLVLAAGFRGVRVNLAVQFDDDELPDVRAQASCAALAIVGEPAPNVDWVHYYDTDAGLSRVPGRIEDTTAQLTRSGLIKFTVPLAIADVPSYVDLRAASTLSPLAACLAMGEEIHEGVGVIGQPGPSADVYRTVISSAVDKLRARENEVKPALAHPLDPTLRARAKLWLRLTLPVAVTRPRVRMVTFNSVTAVQATSVENEILGRADGRPGQVFNFATRNLLEGSAEIAVRESNDPSVPLVTWRVVSTLDALGPLDAACTIDWEAGSLSFGDGRHGRIPPLVPGAGEVIALRYQFGGGRAGEIGVRGVESLETGALGVTNAVNVVRAMGGRDAEQLDDAKIRARKELSSRTRAVTAEDFEFIARDARGVRVARAHVIPLRRPLDPTLAVAPITPRCGPAIAAGASGVNTDVAPGAVTIVVVPDEQVAEPMPTPSFLRTVCAHVDRYRLVTTELHVVPPQYVRICKLLVSTRARPGYSRAMLQAAVEASLGKYLHALTGGDEGTGFPFGARLHVADLVNAVARTEGVDRVESLSAEFTRTKSNVSPRQGLLLLCPARANEWDQVELGPDENVSIDVTSIAVGTVGT
jgi:predicted phage baseplate assembly protein